MMLLLALAVAAGSLLWLKQNTFTVRAAKLTPSTSTNHTSVPDFDTQIKPIFQARCQPCHFQGGQVYDKMPFDKPATITRLGTKLFTRIKDDKEQKLIREFLDGSKAESK